MIWTHCGLYLWGFVGFARGTQLVEMVDELSWIDGCLNGIKEWINDYINFPLDPISYPYPNKDI